MPIETDERNDTRIITLHGDINFDDSLQFARAMKDTVAGTWNTIIVVLETLVVNSHCLGTVLATSNALRSTSKELKLVCVDSPVLKSLTTFRILPRVAVFPTVEAAMFRNRLDSLEGGGHAGSNV